MVAIIDYGAGNLQSVKKAIDFIGAESIITSNKSEILNASHVILPGVGSFGDAMNSMNSRGLTQTVKQAALSGVPFFGICLGLQLLFESSEESPGVDGLGIFKGKIVEIPRSGGLKVPHIGWNSLEITQKNGIFNGIANGSYVYFVHSYYLESNDKSIVSAKTQYGIPIECAVSSGSVFATQFHPEKSSAVGLKILKNFLEAGNN